MGQLDILVECTHGGVLVNLKCRVLKGSYTLETGVPCASRVPPLSLFTISYPMGNMCRLRKHNHVSLGEGGTGEVDPRERRPLMKGYPFPSDGLLRGLQTEDHPSSH